MELYGAIDIGTNSDQGRADGTCRGRRLAGGRRPRGDRQAGPGRPGNRPAPSRGHGPGRRRRGPAGRGVLRGAGAGRLAAVGTMALRSAANAGEFRERILAEHGVEVEVISGEEEARLSFLGAAGGRPGAGGPVAVADIGGGSTELIFGRGAVLESRASVDLGALHVTERFLPSDPPAEAEVAAAAAHVRETLAGLSVPPGSPLLVAIGGTATTLAAVVHGLAAYDAAVVHGSVLDAGDGRRTDRALPQRDAGGAPDHPGPAARAGRHHPGRQPDPARRDGPGRRRARPPSATGAFATESSSIVTPEQAEQRRTQSICYWIMINDYWLYQSKTITSDITNNH